MKKLLLILLCLPLVYSCNKKQKTVEKKTLKENVTSSENLAYISASIKIIPEPEVKTPLEDLIPIEDNTQLVDNEIIILKSYSLAEKTLINLGKDISLARDYVDKLNIKKHGSPNILKIDLEVDTSIANEMVEYLNKLIYIYAQSKIEAQQFKHKKTIDFLQNKADSVARELDLVVRKLTRVKDINPRIIKSSDRLQEIQLQRDVEVLQAMYIEIIKNLEISKVTLLNQIPIINIIDRPKAPIHKNQKSAKTAIIVAFILGICISIFYFIIRKFIKDVLKE